MRSNKKISIVLAVASLFSPAIVFAATSATGDQPGNYNLLLISLVTLIIVLLFIIGVLANTLRQLSFAVRDKMRKERKVAAQVVKTMLLMLAFSLPLFHSLNVNAGEEVKAAAVQASNSISGIAENDFYTIMGVIALEIIVIFALVTYMRVLLKVISGKPEAEVAAKEAPKQSWFWDKFNAAAKIENEKDVLLDHNYDGIQELDNALPPWWKYGFYLTIIVAIIYLYRYHISHDGPSQHDEFVAEMKKGEEDKAAYLAKSANNVDESTVVILTNASEIAEGREIFIKNCSPCHLADGGGNVGPNLTDEYWLHGGSIKDVFKSIKYGWQDKGMKSWKDDFSPKQIQELASFVKSLKGTHPATPKAPQGDLYIEASQGGNDSTKTDSAKAGKVVIK